MLKEQIDKSILKSLYLPASIEILENPIGIPQKVIREKGGYEYVLNSWQHLKSMATKCSAIIEKCTALGSNLSLEEYERTYQKIISELSISWLCADTFKMSDRLYFFSLS